MTRQIRLLCDQNTVLLACSLLLILVAMCDSARPRRARRRLTSRMPFTKAVYDSTIFKLLEEKRYEDFASAWMRFILDLEDNVTSQIFHPQLNGGERLCNDIQLLNLELDTVLVPLKGQKEEVVYIARKIFKRYGPKFIFELLPDNVELKKVFNWNDYQLSRFYRLWMETKLIWEEFKEAYLLMRIKCFHLHKL